MASSPTEPVRARGKGYVAISGSFAPNGSSAVSAASNKGAGFSVVRTSEGLFTLTFDEKYKDLVSATATLQLATATGANAQVGTYTAASKTLVITIWDPAHSGAAAVGDVAADANNRVNFHCVFKNTSPFK